MDNTPLISAEHLLDHLEDPRVKIFDIRGVWGGPPEALPENYRAGHIPGAVYLDWTKELISTAEPLEDAPPPDINQARASFAALGISAEDTVVLYDDYHHMFASRLWWVMRYFGHNGVRILNGGWDYWKAKGYPVSTEDHRPASGDFVPQVQSHLRVGIDDVINRTKDIVLVDGRGAQSYTGTAADPRSGHIPGAVNVPFRNLVDDESFLFKDDATIEQHFASANINLQNATIMSSCGSGYAGAAVLVALKKLGINAPLYDGSFSEWKKDPERPVEQAL